ncbi:MAG: hypothetical protein OJI70_01615 [Zavarzinia sp.]|nr:hypothetical protein [Zavarzinia sp.]
MARETLHIVQTFVAARGGLRAEPAQQFPTAERARREAEKLAGAKLGVVAFSSSGDSETGEFDDQPVILFRAGKLPEQFEG